MGELSIVTTGKELLVVRNTILRLKASEMEIDDETLELCKKIAGEMFEVMYQSNGAALAAPQVGLGCAGQAASFVRAMDASGQLDFERPTNSRQCKAPA